MAAIAVGREERCVRILLQQTRFKYSDQEKYIENNFNYLRPTWFPVTIHSESKIDDPRLVEEKV